MKELSTEAMREWLAKHRAAIAAGVRVGEIDRNKAQRFSLEIFRREREGN